MTAHSTLFCRDRHITSAWSGIAPRPAPATPGWWPSPKNISSWSLPFRRLHHRKKSGACASGHAQSREDTRPRWGKRLKAFLNEAARVSAPGPPLYRRARDLPQRTVEAARRDRVINCSLPTWFHAQQSDAAPWRAASKEKAPPSRGALESRGSTLTSSLVPAWCDLSMALADVVAHCLPAGGLTLASR
jgi:hypothetical protein